MTGSQAQVVLGLAALVSPIDYDGTNIRRRAVATLVRPEPSFEEAIEIQNFWNQNYQRLLNEYPEQFVAVDMRSGEVVAANSDLAFLAYDLRDKGLDPRTDVAIQHLTAKSASLLL